MGLNLIKSRGVKTVLSNLGLNNKNSQGISPAILSKLDLKLENKSQGVCPADWSNMGLNWKDPN